MATSQWTKGKIFKVGFWFGLGYAVAAMAISAVSYIGAIALSVIAGVGSGVGF